MKISFDNMKFILRPSLSILQNAFSKHNYEIRIVGGAVRDLLMEKIPTDLDIATAATPTEMLDIFSAENIRTFGLTTAKKHGTIMARIDGDNFACSTLRHYKILNETEKEIKFIRDWEQDANRRDLTINAMFLGLDGTLYDYFNGVQHLKERRVKFVEKADDRIIEDPFRIIRYFRFFGMLTNDPDRHDSEAIESIIRNRDRLEEIPIEKTIVEFRKVLTGNYNFEMLCKMIECGLGDYVGLSPEFDFDNVAKIHEKIKGSDYHYCLLLAAGMRNEDDVNSFIDKVKPSNVEKDMLLLIIKYRNLFHNNQSLDVIKDIFVDVNYKYNKGSKFTLEFCKQLLLYVGRKDLLREINVNCLPRFPVREGILERSSKKVNSRERKKLLELWKESNYKLSKEELLSKM